MGVEEKDSIFVIAFSVGLGVDAFEGDCVVVQLAYIRVEPLIPVIFVIIGLDLEALEGN